MALTTDKFILPDGAPSGGEQDMKSSTLGEANVLDKLDPTPQSLASTLDLPGILIAGVDYTPVAGELIVTAVPLTSGTITLDLETLAYHKSGPIVHVQGGIDVSAVSSPIGAFFRVTLPFPIADLTEISGRFGTSCIHVVGADNMPVAMRGLESATTFSVYVDTATIAVNDSFYFDFQYTTGA